MKFNILRRAAVLAGWVLVWSGVAPALAAQPDATWVGRRVMVVREGAQFRVEQQSLAPAPLGLVLEVSQVNGSWLWFRGRRGWLEQSYVALYEEAIPHFTAELQRHPTSQAYQRRGIAYAAMDRLEEAVTDFSESLRRDANNLAAQNDRGNALRRLGRWDESLADFSALIQRGVQHPAVYTNRGLVRHEQGRYDEALADFDAALAMDPQFAAAWEAGGAAREAKGDYAQAIANYRQALQVEPNFDRAHNNLAWILATHPDAQLRDAAAALQHATKGNELTDYADADYLDTLAAAHAEAGQFDEAVKRAQEAVQKTSAKQQPLIQTRLKLYEAKKPYREAEGTSAQGQREAHP